MWADFKAKNWKAVESKITSGTDAKELFRFIAKLAEGVSEIEGRRESGPIPSDISGR